MNGIKWAMVNAMNLKLENNKNNNNNIGKLFLNYGENNNCDTIKVNDRN